MSLVDLPEPVAGPGETLVRVSRTGVNYADTHATRNDYLAEQELPLIPGAELVGRTEDGRRVAAIVPNGAYAEAAAVPDQMLVPIPDEVEDEQAVGLLIQGLTADAILRISGRMQPGESVVIAAAAGGTGNARGVARVHALLANGGTLDGVSLLSPGTVERIFDEQIHVTDQVLRVPMRYGIGFGLMTELIPLSPNPRSCFWGGWGGSIAVIDCDTRTTVAYVMNKMASGLVGDTRGGLLAVLATNAATARRP